MKSFQGSGNKQSMILINMGTWNCVLIIYTTVEWLVGIWSCVALYIYLALTARQPI